MYLKNKHFQEIISNHFSGGGIPTKSYKITRLSSKAVEVTSEKYRAIIYVNTIVFLDIGGKITLNTGGWETVTTKKWMNYGLAIARSGYNVYQKRYQWYISKGNRKIVTEEFAKFDTSKVVLHV